MPLLDGYLQNSPPERGGLLNIGGPRKSRGEALPGNVWTREPYPSEAEFFRRKPNIPGMATDDGFVILNPATNLSRQQLEFVKLNEAARVFMQREEFSPAYGLTAAQEEAFKDYGPPDAIRATIAARMYSGDPSAGDTTEEQRAFVRELAQRMGVWDE
jgi:hypothetical protein